MDQLEALSAAERAHRPLLWVCLSFMSGIVWHEYCPPSLWMLGLCAVAAMILGVLFKSHGASIALILIGVVLTGAVHAQNDQTFSSDHINKITYSYRQEPLLIEGVVSSDVQSRPFFKGRKTVFILEVERVKTRWGWKRKKGQVLVNLFREDELRYGDRVLIEGKFHRPFNFSSDTRFSYRDYLYRQGIEYILSVKKAAPVNVIARDQGHTLIASSWRFKQVLVNVLKKNLPAAESGFMRALLLGDRYDIPPQVYELFRLSGVAHIIAISGFNIAIVASGILFFLRMLPIPRRVQLAATILLLGFYAFLTGAQPPVVRATIMATVFLLSFIFERESNSVNSLSLAALLILLMNPRTLFDVGFQLSFVSVLFLILGYPRLMNGFYRLWPGLKPAGNDISERGKGWWQLIGEKALNYLLRSLAVSLAAYFGVLALVVYYFQVVTPIVILANLVVVPLASLCIYLGMGLLVVGLAFPWLAFTFSNCLILVFNIMVISVAFFVRVPGAYFSWPNFSTKHVVLYYAMIILGSLSAYVLARKSRRGAIDKAEQV